MLFPCMLRYTIITVLGEIMYVILFILIKERYIPYKK